MVSIEVGGATARVVGAALDLRRCRSESLEVWVLSESEVGGCTVAQAQAQEFLRDRSKVQNLVQLFDPVVRAVDGIAGERVSMRVDLACSDGRNTLALFSHRRLSVSVGFATAAFVLAILEGSTQPGVWFPEEPEGIAIEAREPLLRRAAQGTISFVMNKPPWMDGGNRSKRAWFRNISVIVSQMAHHQNLKFYSVSWHTTG
ncbi:saccharopine dehydrogenase [Actinidia rufa]|uniref:Saccharopine dehydrogenase n=1 Tax=Actinidia rufa TaxID=165716 RepID=A0A7J0F6H9_9ERIC|nr:saccharopine dehydrogenase [Actinidia rufa]